jgi:ParB family chromosome partitioning protein
LAARILGKAGEQAAAGSAAAVEKGLAHWRATWEALRRKARQTAQDDPRLGKIAACLESLIWAAGKLGVKPEAVLAVATANPDDPAYRPVRLEAFTTLTGGKLSDAVLDALEKAATGGDPEARTLAVEAIARHDPARAAALAEQTLSDRLSFNRLAASPGVDVTETLRTAAEKVHYQGVALPHLVARGDIDGLMAVVDNGALSETTRLGAVEALARMAKVEAEAKLVEVGKNTSLDEELRKEAWRGLRRSKRARKKAEKLAQAVVT